MAMTEAKAPRRPGPLAAASPPQARVLVAGGSAPDYAPLEQALLAEQCTLAFAADGPAVLQALRDAPPDLLLLDLRLGGADPYALCRSLRDDPATRQIAVLLVRDPDNLRAEALAFAAGAADCLCRPWNLPVALGRIRAQLARRREHSNSVGLLRDLFEFASDALLLVDEQGRIMQINARAQQLFGYSRDELVGVAVETLMPQRLRRAHVGHRAAYAREGSDIRMGAGLTCLRRDGSELSADIHIRRMQTAYGRLLLVLLRDASERLRLEQQAQDATRYSRSQMEVSPDPLLRMDTKGRVTDANLAVERITGLTREQLIGSDAAQRFIEPERLHRAFARAVAEGQVFDYPMTIRHASGRQTEVMCNVGAYRNHHGEVVGICASARDMTESGRVRQEIMASRQRVRELAAQSESVREEEKKHIAREVHDELGQVLSALRIELSLLGMQAGAEDPALLEKVQGMKGLVDRAIQGVRNVAGNLRPAALDMGLVAAIEWLCAEFTRHTRTPCRVRADQAGIEPDEARAMALFRIVQESLTNITRYAQAGQVSVGIEHSGNLIRLKIRDDGRGFDPAEVGRKKSYGLLGMRERAIVLGGRVKIVSAPGQGTLVDVVVPKDLDSAKDSLWSDL